MRKYVSICFILVSLLFASCYTSNVGRYKGESSSSSGWQYDGYSERGGLDFSLSDADESELLSEIQLVGADQKRELGNVKAPLGRLSETKSEVDKKVIFNGNMTLSVKNIDSTSYQLEAIAKKYEGYASEIGTYRTTIRVKSAMVKEAMKDIGELGYVQNKRLSGNDVTNEYLDFQIRLDNAVKARERYLQLLEKAENVEAALLVEKELERLNGTIDMIKGNMNRINHLSEFSTITVNINEKKKPGILGYIGIGLYRSVKWLFVRN